MHNADNIVKWIHMVRQFHTRFELDYGSLDLRTALAEEEIGELRQAIADNNKLEILDGLCDVIYIISGTILQKLATCENDLITVHNSALYYSSFNNLLRKLNVNNSIYELLLICIEIAKCYNLDLVSAFDIVHHNNMQKVWTKEQVDALPSDCLYATKQLAENEYAVKSQQGKLLKPPGHVKPNLDPMNLLK